MAGSLRVKRGKLHHPERVTAGSILSGRHFEPLAIQKSRQWMARQVVRLSTKPYEELTFKERHLLKRLMATPNN